MPVYPSKIADLINSFGTREGANASDVIGRAASFECGSFVEVSLRVDSESNKIENMRYRTNGCGFMIAAAESVIRLVQGSALTDLHGSANINSEIVNILETVPSQRIQCVDIAVVAFRSALAEHRKRVIEEFQGERALICTCFGVPEDRIVSEIEADPNADLESIGRATNAGTGCGSCQMLIAELIESANVDFKVLQ